jgi:hypothetical protein
MRAVGSATGYGQSTRPEPRGLGRESETHRARRTRSKSCGTICRAGKLLRGHNSRDFDVAITIACEPDRVGAGARRSHWRRGNREISPRQRIKSDVGPRVSIAIGHHQVRARKGIVIDRHQVVVQPRIRRGESNAERTTRSRCKPTRAIMLQVHFIGA